MFVTEPGLKVEILLKLALFVTEVVRFAQYLVLYLDNLLTSRHVQIVMEKVVLLMIHVKIVQGMAESMVNQRSK